ncbi:hypothetical protein ASD80_09970 [Devosia sp. Root635]|nr:hypothetical protein ASD80_09970 [Devosia sp. Root635]
MGFEHEVTAHEVTQSLVVVRFRAQPGRHFPVFHDFHILRASGSVARSGAAASSDKGSIAQGLRLALSARGQSPVAIGMGQGR